MSQAQSQYREDQRDGTVTLTADRIGRLTEVPLRTVFLGETHLTNWLVANVDVLNGVLGRSLSNAQREQAAGDFRVDLIAEDEDGHLVVIENQLERSNHEHLGKLLTYLTAFEAKVAVWIVSDPRPEHVSAITSLNQSYKDVAFYFVKVQAVKIGDSLPAPLLTLIVGPSEVIRRTGEVKEEWAERHKLRHRFWAELLERARPKSKLFSSISPSRDSWISAGSGRGGLWFSYTIRMKDASVDLSIDRGPGAEQQNRSLFETLHSRKEDIERAFGGPLDWSNVEGRRSLRIIKRLDAAGLRDESRWPQIQDAMIDSMVRLEKALRPHLSTLPLG